MNILLIVDDEKLLRLLSHDLRGEGYTIGEAADAKSGLRLALNYHYDLIILDVAQPGISGTELLRELRRSGNQTPTIMVSAKDAPTPINTGADDYLLKPFVFAELRQRITALSRRSAIDSHIRLGDLIIDCLSRQVIQKGKRILLTDKEYALLEYLACNRGRILSRAMILSHIWGSSFENIPGIVDATIHQLRTKIDRDFIQPLIHTKRGLGYTVEYEDAS